MPTPRSARPRVRAALFMLLAVAACSDDPPVSPNAAPGARLASAPVSEQEALRQLARAVALALGDADLRAQLKQGMRAVPMREHKLELRAFTRSKTGAQLLARMAAASGTTPAAIAALVARVRPLEVYLPVQAHRERWLGGYQAFERNSTGTYVPANPILIAEPQSLAVDEKITGPHGIVYHRRLDQLEAPYQIYVVERDDGKECPTPPRKQHVAFGFEVSLNPFKFRLRNLGWEDVNALFGGGNEFLGGGQISSIGELETLNRTLPGGDIDITVVSRGFSRTAIPAEQNPYAGG